MSADAPRVVLDLNVFVSGLLAERSGASTPPARCLAAARAAKLRLCFSPGTLARLHRVLHYPKLAFDPQAVDALSHEIVAWVGPAGWVPDPPRHATRRPLCPDPEDAAVLPLALAARAEFLVTGDAHLLKHLRPQGRRIVRKAGLQIVTAGEFVTSRLGEDATEH